MISKGYIGLFKEPLTEKHIQKCVDSWLSRFEKVEQVSPGGGVLTINIATSKDIAMEENQQFRILMGADFTWVYLTKGRYVIETTGLPSDASTLCLDVLMELPGVEEIIDQKNDKRLDQLEAEGLM